MKVVLEVQNIVNETKVPSDLEMRQWLKLALTQAGYQRDKVEVTVRIVSKQESQCLNHQYRGKDQPTNILSFPFEAPPQIDCDLLGDLVICYDVVIQEAQIQSKSLHDHWAHMLIHGMLHLLGFDHIEDEEAEEMESLEISILDFLHIKNPYIAGT